MEKVDTGVATSPVLQRHGHKFVALALWALLLTAYFWSAQRSGFSLRAGLIQGRNSPYAPLIFIFLFALRPLIFFPASLFSIAGGLLFGVVGGTIYTTIGANLSAMIAYVVGRYFGRGLLEVNEGATLAQRYAARLRANSFDTVLIMRLVLLPYDFVNYLAGFLRIDWQGFFLATLIGSIPASLSLVLIGVAGDLDELMAGKVSLNPWALLGSVLLLGASLVVSRYMRRKESLG